MKTLIKSGLIVMENSRMVGDVLIDDERISKIDSKIDEPADQIIDAGGKILIPGGIDVHTHFNIDVGVVA
ncbi:MAG: dihydropyrimidinase, partial [Clostridiales bacterium]|nr:dihydropyrimidinase [Clostridiales bacterium]MDY3746405.1 dihydropyrimidinase [Lachnospiraceae bacterium]